MPKRARIFTAWLSIFLVCTWTGPYIHALAFSEVLPSDTYTEISCSHKPLHAFSVSSVDLDPLLAGEYINDVIITSYFKLLACHYETLFAGDNSKPKFFVFDSLIYNALMTQANYNYDKIVRLSGLHKPRSPKLFDCLQGNPNSFTHLVLPCNTGGHWILLIVDLKQKRWFYFDSCWDYSNGIPRNVIRNVERFLAEYWKKNTQSSTEPFPLFTIHEFEMEIPQQSVSSHNCGPFVCMFGRWVFFHGALTKVEMKPPFLSCERVSQFRRWIKEEFEEGGLISLKNGSVWV